MCLILAYNQGLKISEQLGDKRQIAVSKGQLGVAEKAISQAEENYRVTDNQFRERVATTTDLINARILLTRAKNNYNAALYSLHLSSEQIQRVIEKHWDD